MRNTLPKGNAAIAISQAGHEIALHGLIEKTKPYIFIMTDGSGKNRGSRMVWMHKYLVSVYPDNLKDMYNIMVHGNREGEDRYIKARQVYEEILLKRVAFFAHYTGTMAEGLVRKKIDYIVTEAVEGNDPIQDLCAIMTEVAVKLVEEKTGKKIDIYQFNLTRPINTDISDKSIHLQLSPEAIIYKSKLLAYYQGSIFEDFKANVSVDMNHINKMKEMPKGDAEVAALLQTMDIPFFKEEYLNPYSYVDFEDKPTYEVNAENIITEGIPTSVISYKEHIKPLKEMLEKVALTPKDVAPAIN